MIQFGARFQTEKEPQNASECQICITFHQTDVKLMFEIKLRFYAVKVIGWAGQKLSILWKHLRFTT